MTQPTLTLNTGTTIPQLGFGTWQLQDKICYDSIISALEIGYRHIDTAHIYGNHTQVGEAIKDYGLNRSELFITSKLWRNEMHSEQVTPALERTLEELQTTFLDLFLIHWPNKQIPIHETLSQLQYAKNQGLIKAFGVSNFTLNHLQSIEGSEFDISVNQVEFHPSLNQDELLRYCQSHNIVLTAYSPIAQGFDLKLPLVQELASKYSVSPSQIILNWLIQKKTVAIPRSSSKIHIQDNFDSYKWQMQAEDVFKLDQLNQDYRVVNPSFAEFDL